jgi:hypothetical protein
MDCAPRVAAGPRREAFDPRRPARGGAEHFRRHGSRPFQGAPSGFLPRRPRPIISSGRFGCEPRHPPARLRGLTGGSRRAAERPMPGQCRRCCIATRRACTTGSPPAGARRRRPLRAPSPVRARQRTGTGARGRSARTRCRSRPQAPRTCATALPRTRAQGAATASTRRPRSARHGSTASYAPRARSLTVPPARTPQGPRPATRRPGAAWGGERSGRTRA